MAIKSMTGYGKGTVIVRDIKVESELSSVNSRQLDIRINLPKEYVSLESRLQKLINQELSRGYISGNVKVLFLGKAKRSLITIDTDLAEYLVRGLRQAGERLGLKHDISTRTLLSLPEVIRYQSVAGNTDRMWPVLKKSIQAALKQLVRMREVEGLTIEKDLNRHLLNMRGSLNSIRKMAPKVRKQYQAAILRRLKGSGAITDSQVLIKEVALMAERSDISEEISRLDSHFKQISGLLKARTKSGRTLDFLCQEILREVNTIGAKADDVIISKHVIKLKTGLDSFREQVQNVE